MHKRESQGAFCHRAKPATEMKRSGIEEAARRRECEELCLHKRESQGAFCHRAKPATEMKRSGIEEAARRGKCEELCCLFLKKRKKNVRQIKRIVLEVSG